MMNRAIATSAALLALVSCSGRIIHKEPATPEPITVRVMETGISDKTGRANYVGTVEASRTAVVSSQNSGTLKNFRLKAGDRVAGGQRIADIESQGIRSAYESSKATLDQAEDGWERIQQVQKTGSVANVKVVELQTKLEQARAAELAARSALENMTVCAPFSGVVDEVFVTDGVKVGAAEPLLRIVDAGSVEIHFPLPENEFSKVKVGDKATVVIPALDITLEAELASKGVTASKLAHSYDCVLGLPRDAAPGIMPGMACKVYISSELENLTVIPASAVMTDMEGRYVWTVEDCVVGRRHISVDGYSGNGIIVSGGLEPGDLIIIEGSRKVSTGMKVKVIE